MIPTLSKQRLDAGSDFLHLLMSLIVYIGKWNTVESQRVAASIIPWILPQHQVSHFSFDAKNLVQGWSIVSIWLSLMVAENPLGHRVQLSCVLSRKLTWSVERGMFVKSVAEMKY